GFIVLAVRHYLQDEDLLGRVADAGNQPVLVAADVKDDAVADEARTGERGFHLSPGLPRDGLAVDVRIPRPEWAFGVPVAGRRPKLLRASLGDDPHPPPLVSCRGEL